MAIRSWYCCTRRWKSLKLEKTISKSDILILTAKLGNGYEVMKNINEVCYVLDANGDYLYNECFVPTEIEMFQKQKYQLVTPRNIIKYYNFYLMKCSEEPDVWFRGIQNANGNYEFDCYADNIDDIISLL